MRTCMALLVLLLIGACVAHDLPPSGSNDPLVYDAIEIDEADTLAIFVPGALSPIEIFKGAQDWRMDGYALVYYRLPGLDGLPLDHRLDIEASAQRIARFIRGHPGKQVRLVGYSTGAAIALTAASKVPDRNIRVAAVSSAVPYPASICAGWRGFLGIIRSIIRTSSLNRETIWRDYYRTLIFGVDGRRDPARSADIERIIAVQQDRIVVPRGSMLEAHSGDLSFWQPESSAYGETLEVRFFHGSDDPVISLSAITKFQSRFRNSSIQVYPGHGHILFFSTDTLFREIQAFFDNPI